MAFKHYAQKPLLINSIIVLVLLILSQDVNISSAASGGSGGGSAGGSGGGGSSAISNAADSENTTVIIIVLVITGVSVAGSIIACLGRRSILMLQIGLGGEARPSLQRQINLTVMGTDTSSVEGWHHILIETINTLLRHSQHFISAHSSVEKRWSNQDVLERFEEVSKEEHQKFDIESLVNFNNTRRHRHVIREPRQLDKDFTVVTMLVATKCGYKAPPVMTTINDVKEALQFFTGIDISQILAVEVLWTPQDENDTMSEQELEGKYSHLRPIRAS